MTEYSDGIQSTSSSIMERPAIASTITSRSCRMSWFLVQQLHTKTLSIIHSVDLIDHTGAEIYLNQTIAFHRDQSTLEGVMLCAADNRQFVEDELKKRLAEQHQIAQFDPSFGELWFLLQFQRTEYCLVHRVVRKSEIPWHLNTKYSNHREILIEDGNARRLATILHFSNNETDMHSEIAALRSECVELAFEQQTTSSKNLQWILLQYSDGTNNVIYSIIDESQTIWNRENFYNEYITYIRTDNDMTVNQAVILKKSKYLDELQIELENIKENTLLSAFPLGTNSIQSI